MANAIESSDDDVVEESSSESGSSSSSKSDSEEVDAVSEIGLKEAMKRQATNRVKARKTRGSNGPRATMMANGMRVSMVGTRLTAAAKNSLSKKQMRSLFTEWAVA